MMKKEKKQILGLSIILIALFSFGIYSDPKPTIHSIGDSTMSDYGESYLNRFGGEGYPIRGWMQMMPEFVKPETVTINNAARSGRSSKSFREEGFWDKVKAKIQPGDYVFIQFGHNDAKEDSLRHTDPQTTFKENIRNYVEEVKAKDANPILFTSIVRRRFDKNGKIMDFHGEYVTVIRDLANEMNVPLVDLNKLSAELVESYGVEKSKELFLYIEPGRFSKLPNGKQDNAHLCVEGARKIAELAVKSMKEQNLPVAKCFL